MTRHEFLAELHRRLAPRTYLEIGVKDGRSLALSRARSIGIDPSARITVDIVSDAQVVKATSDAFFARRDPLAHFRGRRSLSDELRRRLSRDRTEEPSPTIDLAFIDGMHLVEFALRDFMNVERHTTPTSVVVFDDMLPRNVAEAARDRTTKFWAGDVFKMQAILRAFRPDLIAIPVDTAPTGLLVVLRPDAHDRSLADQYDAIVADAVQPDPQVVPDAILERRDAVAPDDLLSSPVWSAIDSMRAAGTAGPDLERALSTLDGLVRGRSGGR
ncbi:MAG TPA: class I SAM-dependent methyltransferase [Candidatus Limnocylindrales bacterium]|nr:class I SAM-dependent methyltransferase [Candidatus Limnocylindrales bacterium]